MHTILTRILHIFSITQGGEAIKFVPTLNPFRFPSFLHYIIVKTPSKRRALVVGNFCWIDALELLVFKNHSIARPQLQGNHKKAKNDINLSKAKQECALNEIISFSFGLF